MGVPQAVQIWHPSDFGPQVGSTWRPGALRRLTCAGFGPPEGRFSTLRGAIFTFFKAAGCIFEAVLWTKLMQPCRQHRNRRTAGKTHDSNSYCVHTTVLCAKLMQAYVQHRSTCLSSFCMWINFYMWINTATDSRSIEEY